MRRVSLNSRLLMRSACVISIVCAIKLGTALQAFAHSWYPHYCCSEQDCVKVDRIEYVTDGMYMTAGQMRVFVPDSMEKRPSEDTDAHICVMRTQSGLRVRCVFLPGTA
jgi:hypothetical protein